MHEPNLQNIPRDFIIEDATKTVTISLRNAFVASENCLLVSADYCQIELRMLAHLSADSKLIKNIVDSQDIFVSIAAYIFGIPPYEVSINTLQLNLFLISLFFYIFIIGVIIDVCHNYNCHNRWMKTYVKERSRLVMV